MKTPSPGEASAEPVQTCGQPPQRSGRTRNAWYAAALAAAAAPAVASDRRLEPIERLRKAGMVPASEWPAAAAFLRAAIEKYLSGVSRSMDEALQLAVAPSERSLLTQAAFEERDRWLVKAGEEFDLKLYPTAEKLRAEILRVEEVYWPKWCERTEAPQDATRLRALLFLAYKAAPRDEDGTPEMPRSVGQVYKALKKAKGLS